MRLKTSRNPGGETETDGTELKLLEAAGQVFSEVGFQAATVRDVCTRAGVNIAAVKYHFGDKLGLYMAVMRSSFSTAEHEAARMALTMEGPPEERFRNFVKMLCRRMNTAGRPSWYVRIMAQEMAKPTPALARVADEVIRPNYMRLAQLLGEMIGRPPLHDQTRMCIHSVIGQLMHYAHARAVLSHVWPDLKMTPARIDEIADHIASFSLAGFAAVAASGAKTKRKTRQVRPKGKVR